MGTQVLGTTTTESNYNAIGAYAYSAFRFTSEAGYTINSVDVYVAEDGGLVTCYCELWDSSGGEPNAQTGVDSGNQTVFTAAADSTFTFGTPPTCADATEYWLVFRTAEGTYIRTGENLGGVAANPKGWLTSGDGSTWSDTASGRILDGNIDINYTLTPVNKTLNPSALTLSLTETSPLYLIDVTSLSLSGGLTLPTATPSGMNIKYLVSSVQYPYDPQTPGMAGLRPKFPITKGLNAGYQTQQGRNTILTPKNSVVPKRSRQGL